MSTPQERAQRRRSEWSSEVIEGHPAKGPLYSDLPLAERWAKLVELNERVWLAAGNALPEPTTRAEWPGEIFELTRHD